MSHPFRRYSYIMADRLGMTLEQVQREISSYGMSEWMAFELTQDSEWVKKYKADIEREKSKSMTNDEKLNAFKKLLGGK